MPRLLAVLAPLAGLLVASGASADDGTAHLRFAGMRSDTVGPASRAEYAIETDVGDDLADVARVELLLPDGTYLADRTFVTRRSDGVSWRGRILEAWDVLLTVHQGALAGLIETPSTTYELLFGPDGQPRLAELDPGAFPPCESGDLAGEAPGASSAPSTAAAPATAGDPIVLDALVVYTPAARQGAGGRSRIEATIQAAVDATNLAYTNSDVDVRLHLVHTAETRFDDTGSASSDLTNVRTSTTVVALRNQQGADLVGLIINRNNACGLGYVQRRPGSGFADFAYQVTARGCAVGNLSFAHEFGHNQGCEHDPANGTSPSNASFPYSFGHFHSGAYRTVMSYSNQCTGGCGRRAYFSNPAISFSSLATGVANQRDNHQTIERTASIVAAFRPSAASFDLDRAQVSVREDGGAVNLVVSRTGLVDREASVGYRTVADTAVEGADYAATSGTLTWTAGDRTTRVVTVPLIDDDELEGPERFSLELRDARGAGLGATSVTTIDLEDYETGVLRLTSATAEIREDAGRVVLTVERVSGRQGAVGVDFATDPGTAEADRDFAASSGQLDWADGTDGPRDVVIPLLDDRRIEGDETFTLRLGNPTGGAELGAAETEVTVLDYEEGALGFEVAALTRREDGGAVSVEVGRVDGTDGAVSVGVVALPLDATADADFRFTPTRLEFGDGDAGPRTVVAEVIDDAVEEPSERFALALVEPDGGAAVGAVGTATVTVEDWEPGRIALARSEWTVEENAGSLTLQVVREEGRDGPAEVDLRIEPGTAEAGEDFVASSSRLSWLDGQDGPLEISLPILDDRLDEGPEQLFVRLDAATGARLGSVVTATVTVEDFEEGTLGLVETDLTVAETDGAAVVRVERTGGVDGAVAVRYAAAPGSASAEDFEPVTGEVRFEDGEDGARTIEVPLTDDPEAEPSEALSLVLSDPTGGALLAGDRVEITVEDAGGGRIERVEPSDEVRETAGELVLRFRRAGELLSPVELDVRTRDADARGGADFTPVETRLSWAAGESGERAVALAITADELEEGDETFRVDLSSPRGDVFLPAGFTVTVVDVPPEGCACAAARAPEGGLLRPTWGALLLLAAVTLRRRRRA